MIVVLVVGVGIGIVVDAAAAGVVTIGTLDAGVATEVVGCEGCRTTLGTSFRMFSWSSDGVSL